MGLSKKVIFKSIHDSINAAYIEEDDKQALQKVVDNYFTKYELMN